ncbi:MAG: DUF3108 domain-containing protein [Bacteroidales bacterium]|jgi:hypothetical protein|nr:DUF3108 domain-containing protein [Bacteroidales bacterium]
MAKKYFKIFRIVVLLMFPVACMAQKERKDYPFKGGEQLAYILNYTWGGIKTDVGEGKCSLNYDNGIYKAEVVGYTYKFYDLFFKVREYFSSSFYESDLRPINFERKTSEGKYRITNHYSFTDDAIKVRIRKYDRSPQDTVIANPHNAMDLLTLFFSCRALNFNSMKTGRKHPLYFAIDNKIYDLYFIYYGKEDKKIRGLGTFHTLKFAVKLVAGEIFTGKDDLYVWITDDDNKIPLFFESPILVGRVTGRLKNYSNLNHPLSSKIK